MVGKVRGIFIMLATLVTLSWQMSEGPKVPAGLSEKKGDAEANINGKQIINGIHSEGGNSDMEVDIMIHNSARVHARLLQNGTAVCGNSIVETGETCDDGNTVSGDGCSSTCQTQYCGDGVVNNNGKEQCDTGNNTGTGCINCTLSCGNGVIDAGEECDAGNKTSDECTTNCTKIAKGTYRTALGIGLGVGFIGVIGVVVGSTIAPVGAGVSSSLIGITASAVNSGTAHVGHAAHGIAHLAQHGHHAHGMASEGAKLFQPL